MRKPVVMGNWKLNGTKSTVTDLIKAFREPANKAANVDVAICAPAIFIGMVESLAIKSFKDDKFKTKYINESALNMDNIVNDSMLIYQMLEMVNTTNMVNVDEDFMNNYIKSLA